MRMKAVLIRLVAQLMRLQGPRELPDWANGPHRVLYLRYDRIGDMVLATGIIKALAAVQPAITVDVLASIANAAVLDGNPNVGLIHTIDKKHPWTFIAALARIRQVRYDAVIDAMALAPSLTSLLIMWASGARHRVGISKRGNDAAFTIPVPPLEAASHYVDRSAAVLAAFGADLRQLQPSTAGAGWGIWRPELFLTTSERLEGEEHWHRAMGSIPHRGDKVVRLLVNVSAGSCERYWPEERFIQTLVQVRARVHGLIILVIGSPQDAERMARIGTLGKAQVAYTPNYRRMMGVVATSDVVLTADTSVTHVASAFGKPAVVMFVGGGAPFFGPYGTAGHSISTNGPSLGCMDVSTVMQALLQLLGKSGVARPATPPASSRIA